VASAFGFDAYYGTGSGLGVATNASTGALYNYNNSIPPGTTVVGWGSGLGADQPRDTTFTTPTGANINGLAAIYVGGISAPIGYQGPSGYPGLNQVNFTIPANAPTGCNVSVVGVSAAGVPTNFITLPIGNGPCSDPAFGITGSSLSSLSNQSTVKTGFVLLGQTTAPPANGGGGTQITNTALAAFQSTTGASYGTASGSVSLGGCIVSQSLTSSGSSGTSTGLNAGNITITGPNGSATLTAVGSFLPGYYQAQLGGGFFGSGGNFAVNATAGTDVGAFNTQIVFSNPLLAWTNQSANATITRSAGATINWTGGSSGTFVSITGGASSSSASGNFTCFAPVSAQTFTVPAYVLAAVPAGSGNLSVANFTNYTPFTATGLDFGFAFGSISFNINSTYQ
jgi:hypothetical protein